MAYCTYCGTKLVDGTRFCPNCGNPVGETEGDGRPDPGIGQPYGVGAAGGQAPYSSAGSSYDSGNRSAADPAGMPMGWHKFLMVIFIIGGIISILNGITMLTGIQYSMQGADPDAVYSYFPGLRMWDYVYGVICIALGVFQIYVRNRLNGFYANGPKLLMIFYIVGIVTSVLYLFNASAIIGDAPVESIGSVIVSVVMMIINYIYYRKRKELFVN